jgi:hypothetical protein
MIAGLAVGAPVLYPEGKTVRIKTDISQTGRMDGLPLGTRGGVMIPYNFPRAGTYDIEITLTRDRNESVEGLHEPHDLEVLLNRELVKTFTVVPPVKGKTYHKDVDKHLRLRTHVESGRQEIGVTFVRKPDLLLERIREPFESSFNYHRHPRTSPAVFQVSITGPFEDAGVGDSESRRRIFGRYLDVDVKTDQQARQIIQKLARKAYRRPVNEGDITPLMAFFDAGKETGGFDAGIEAALSAILVNPNFIFRIEHDPAGMESGTPYEVNQIEFASRLSFFLWGSLPDDELLSLAESGELRKPDVLESQVMRMLGDARSSSLTELFAGQWLYLRNIDSVIPDLRLFPDFDENLRKAMRRETELLFEHVMREDKSVLELISADYTFLNERIARHYSLPGIHGDRFRKVKLDESGSRGGILRHASILSVTSYANRTSPVIRGAWILENIIGAPPPPPPPDVPNLEDVVISEDMPLRERLAAHRENPSCAGCHELMDPIGFALEAFDAVGQVRYLENGIPVDASGRVADGSTFAGVADLEDYIVKYPENFVRTMTEKLLTYGLGRGIEYYDMPAIREIVRKSRENDYQFSSLVLGVIQSQPFQQRIVQ